jgi:SOS-response transcriptional repressor LexA
MEPLGNKLRKRRRHLGLTLDELAQKAGISKPYLSLIETGRVANPPSDEKLRRLEQTLGFSPGELVTQAHLQQIPHDVRAILGKLLDQKNGRGVSGALQEMVNPRAAPGGDHGIGNTVPVINGSADQHVGCPEISDKDAFAARVQGDSMIPRYRQGDIVIFAPSLPARDGDDCFVKFADGQTTFKRIFFEVDGEAHSPVVRLQPRNEKYRPLVVKNEQVSGLYRAVYRYQRVDGD